jgi:ribosomal protein S27AE
MPGTTSSIDHLKDEITAAHCAKCDRTSDLAMHGEAFWCAWCGTETRIALRRVRVLREETAHAHTVGSQMVDPENAPLQPLCIPAGWRVAYNNALYAVEPTEETVKWWWIFKQDMLVLVHDERKRLLDLGWSPEMDFVEGRYRLTLYEGDFHGPELQRYETRNLSELVEEIERILDRVACGRL